jgi:hypothetical protein
MAGRHRSPDPCRRLLLSLPLLTLLVQASPCARAQHQVRRPFPADALRGTLLVTSPPEARLNGEAARLAPGARIRDENNLLAMSAALAGRRLTVNYTVESLFDGSVLLRDLWILRPDEIANFWPRSREEAARYQLDPIAQVWSRRSA